MVHRRWRRLSGGGNSNEGSMRKIIQLLLDTRGIGAIEYALIASLISVAALGAYQELGKGVEGQYVEIGNALTGSL
jgi:Flp pilus assembly pilin Flp